MLNKIITMGRFTSDPTIRHTQSGNAVASFTIAVDRDFKGKNGEKETDWLDVVAWRNTAEFVSKYFSKGKSIVVIGQLQVRSYTAQDGSKRYVTEVVADEVSFGANASDGAVKGTAYNTEKRGDVGADDEKYVVGQADFVEVGAEDDLPF